MTQERQDKSKRADERKARLKAALKANLSKRKTQARARADEVRAEPGSELDNSASGTSRITDQNKSE